MRIVIATGVYPPDIGGPASLTEALLAYWNKRGHEVRVVAYGDGTEEFVSRVSRKTPLPLRYVEFAWRTWRLCKGAEVILIQGMVSEGLPATVGALLRGVPRVIRVPGDYAWEIYRQDPKVSELLDDFVLKRHSGKIGLLERLQKWTLGKAQAVITPSQYLSRIVQARGVQEKKIYVILNTINPFTGISSRNIRSLYELDDKKVFLMVSRAVPWKRFDFLLNLFASLPEDHVLVHAGDGPMLTTWKKQVESLHLGDRVKFLGRIDRSELANWYEAADALLLPSSYEGYPFVVAEAVSFGLPCLVSDKAGNPETQEQYPDHVTVLPFDDETAWKETLMKDIPRQSRIQNKSFETFADQILHVLKSYARTDA